MTGPSHTAAYGTGLETRNLPREGGYARCSRVGTRWTTELADVRAPLYIHIYTRLSSIPTLFFIPLSSGVLLAAATSGGGIDDGGSGGGDDGSGSGSS